MPPARSLTERLRRLVPEALAFGVIGAANTVLYMAIFYVTMPIGAVKATVIATVITTTLAYLANRYWTYRHHTRSALRREYTLFFGFNLVGMLIQSGAVAVAKYGVGLNESDHKLAIMGVTLFATGIATVFRFWAYRTFVFLKPPVDGHEDAITELDPAAGLAEFSAEHQPGSAAQLAELEREIELAELDAERPARSGS
ncbi:GtrA family protein [Krasilnikovia sp. MM14-A1004]|uniref:GtrA family protein n=1 Tax=Krasilnikovia sp. MM14-A1004 TaxID=3373541 RepID=UPI00399CEB7E